MEITRRDALKYFGTGTACLALSEFVGLEVVLGQSTEGSLSQEYEYRSWEDLFRKKWTWDKVAYCTHSVGCFAQCQWSVFVKDGIAFREEQLEHPRSSDEEIPDPGPQGCQRGACFTHQMYGPDRIKYPLKRVGKRGEGKWKRVSWDEALTEAADAIIDACVQDGPHSIVNDRGDQTEYAWRNLYKMLGNIQPDAPVTANDFPMGNWATFGSFGLPNKTNLLFQSDLIFIWHCNPLQTRIPYYIQYNQARYRGAEIITVAPDFSPSAVHADYWIPVEPGTDIALALGMCQVILEEKLYPPEFLKEQTDLPFLVREDTREFLRERDLRSGGRDDRFYIYDLNTNRVVQAKRGTLELGPVDPALEGTYEVELSDGRKVQLRPVFERLKEVLRGYTPTAAAELISRPFAKVHPDVIRQVARKAAKAKTMRIIAGMNLPKVYHQDLHGRSIALFLVLSGHARKGGGGTGGGYGGNLWQAGGPRSTLWELVGMMEKPGIEGGVEAYKKRKASAEEVMGQDPEKTARMAWGELEKRVTQQWHAVPGWQWMYYRAGFKDRWNNKQWHDPGYRDFQSYVDEANRKGWYDGFIGPDKEKIPVRDRVMISAGGSYLRRMTGSKVFFDDYTPSLEKIIKVDFRMSASTLYADIVLPCAGYYEKIHVRRSGLWLMDKAVEPLGESKSDWSIACLLAKYISKRAKERGITKVQDTRRGTILELDKLYDKYTVNGAYKEGDEEKLADTMYRIAAELGYLAKGTNLETMRKNRGFTTSPDRLPRAAIAGSNDGEHTVYATLTRRMQFYLDHDWFLEAGEELPVHRPHPPLGGEYPFHQTGGHGRESVHSMWITNPLLLRLTRGVPSLFINPEVAERMGIEDFEEVEVYNDAGLYRVRVKHSTLMRPNQVTIYHCWEPYQFSKGHWNTVNPGVAKPLMLAGGYGHLTYNFKRWQPAVAARGARVNIRKIS